MKKWVSVWTEIIHIHYKKKLVSGMVFTGRHIVGAINHYSDGRKEYFDDQHRHTTKEYIDACRKAQGVN